VFADTGWEAPETYEYLNTLETMLGIKIHRVERPGGTMIEAIRERAGFPSRRIRWCTKELKVLPIIAFHEMIRLRDDTDTVSVVGIRRDESQARADAKSFEFNHESNWYTWRPLIHWTIPDVLAIHHKHGIPINPLYRKGFGRVGCMPCIMANKTDIRLVAKHYPGRINTIRELEQFSVAERVRRNALEPGRYAHKGGTFFLAGKRNPGEVTPIDRVVAWSKTKRGGKLPLIDETPDSGCFRWGFCDAPTGEEPEPIPAASLVRRTETRFERVARLIGAHLNESDE